MAYLDFISSIHKATKRDYVQRVVEYDKAACAEVSRQFGFDYFDGDRRYGYGGYRYDGRWRPFAQRLIEHYALKPGDRVLDIGCGKGFLVHDFRQALPGLEVRGVDISAYAIAHAMEEVKPYVRVANATELPFAAASFDLVVSVNTLHNLYLYDLKRALAEIERVGRRAKYLVLDSYRNEREKVNLMYWQLTCQCFFTPAEWEWLFGEWGYSGDAGFVFFE
jgi:protein-L-isoaspartate(D-aspartate) O-methyltransferase